MIEHRALSSLISIGVACALGSSACGGSVSAEGGDSGNDGISDYDAGQETSVVAVEQRQPSSIVATSSTLWWTDLGDLGSANGAIYYVDRNVGGAPTEMASARATPNSATVIGSTILWLEGDLGDSRQLVSFDGSSVTTLRSDVSAVTPLGDAIIAFVNDAAGGTNVLRLMPAGGTWQTLLHRDERVVSAAQCAGELVWIESTGIYATGPDWIPRAIVNGSALQAHDWSACLGVGRLLFIPVDGKSIGEVNADGSVRNFADSLAGVSALTTDGTWVWWIESDGTAPGMGRIRRARLDGSELTIVSTGLPNPIDLTPSLGGIAWIDQGFGHGDVRVWP
jgi:hypothetical protein